MKGVVRFGKKGKLSPRYVGPYEILQRVGKVAYELKLPSKLASVHPLIHVSMLKKCIGDPESILPIEGLGVKDNLSYEEVSVIEGLCVKDNLSYEEVLAQILDRQVNKLRNKEVAFVKFYGRIT